MPRKTTGKRVEWRRIGWKSQTLARIHRALHLLASEYVYGPRSRDQVVDQVVRALLNNDLEYEAFVADFDRDADGTTTNRWRDMLEQQ